MFNKNQLASFKSKSLIVQELKTKRKRVINLYLILEGFDVIDTATNLIFGFGNWSYAYFKT